MERDTYLARSLSSVKNETGQNAILELYSKLSSNKLTDPYYKYITSLALIDSGLEREGYSNIKMLSQEDPRNLIYHNSIAYYGVLQNDIQNVISSRNSILQLDPWNLRNRFLLGEIYVKIGQRDKALNLFKSITEIAPKSDEASEVKIILENLE